MNSPLLQEILQRLEAEDPLGISGNREGLAAQSDSYARDSVACVHWRASRLEERRFSSIYLLEPTEGRELVRAHLGSDELVLKVYRAALPKRRQKEFDDLARVHEAMHAFPQSGVVKPVACWADWGAIVTVRAQGVEMSRLLRVACRRNGSAELLARAAVLCTEAGTWMRRFQAAGAPFARGRRPQHLGSADGFLAYLDERLRPLGEGRAAIEPSLRPRLLARAAHTLHALPAESLEPVTWSHADFGPHNVLVDRDAESGAHLTVLDFDLAVEHPYFDAAYFVESLAHLRGPFVEPSRVQRLERAFLAGYGEHLDEPLFALFRLRHLVCSFLSQGRRSGLAGIGTWPGLFGMRARLRHFPEILPLRGQPRAA